MYSRLQKPGEIHPRQFSNRRIANLCKALNQNKMGME